MDLLGTPIFTIGAVDLKGDEGRKRVEEFIKNVDEKIRIVYIGTLGHSYDLKCTIEALNILNMQKWTLF
jgi:hypothetical protein